MKKNDEKIASTLLELLNTNIEGLRIYFYEIKNKNKFRTYDCYIMTQDKNLIRINEHLKTLGLKTNNKGLIKFGRCNDEICFICTYVDNLAWDNLGFPIIKEWFLL